MSDDVYRERAHLVALLAARYPSCIGYTDPDAPDWAVVTIQLSAGGQVTWHISPEDMDLFTHVSTTMTMPWDGHDTDQKYERVRRETSAWTKWRSRRGR